MERKTIQKKGYIQPETTVFLVQCHGVMKEQYSEHNGGTGGGNIDTDDPNDELAKPGTTVWEWDNDWRSPWDD